MAFRGDSDTSLSSGTSLQNDKFLGIMKLLAKFDPAMQNYLALGIKEDASDH